MALSPKASRRLLYALGAVTFVGLGTLGAAYASGAFDKPKPKPKKPPKKLDPFDEDVPLEPWEEEAEAWGQVGDNDEDYVEPDEEAVGEGTPDEHCIPVPEGLGAIGEDAEYECVSDPLGDVRFAPVDRGAPMARVPADSTWPLKTKHRRRLVTSYWTEEGARGSSGRAFGAKRVSDEGVNKWHAGIDLFAREGDIVLAPQAGTILGIYPFHHGSWAIYLKTADDQVINLGEVAPYSWRKFKIRPGVEVTQGQPLAKIGVMSGGSSMMHAEVYDATGLTDEEMIKRIRRGEFRWYDRDAPPVGLLDPTPYLIMAGTHTYRRESIDA